MKFITSAASTVHNNVDRI